MACQTNAPSWFKASRGHHLPLYRHVGIRVCSPVRLPLGIAAPGGLPVGLCAGGAPRLAGNHWLATVLALAKLLGPLSLFLSVAPPVLPALRGSVPGLFVLPARFPRGFGVLGPGSRRFLPLTSGLRLGKFLPGVFGLLGPCAWPAGYRESVLE